MGLGLEELVDELDPLDAVLLAGDLGEIEVHLGHLGPIRVELLVQRPLGQRDLEVTDLPRPGLAGRLVGQGPAGAEAQECPTGDRALQEHPTIDP